MKAGKVWGSTAVLQATPTLEIHKIIVWPNMQCSMHVHRHKINAFLVTEGRLLIDVEKGYGLTDTTELFAGEMTVVPPGEFHRFRTGAEGAEAFELYFPPPLGEDIERRDQGGPITE